MGNGIAYAALFGWPLVAFLLFRRLSVHQAIIWTILGGYLLLPRDVAVDLPLLPAFDKTFIPAAVALLFCLPLLRGPLDLLPRGAVPRILALGFLLGPFITVAMNSAAVQVGPRVLPGLAPYDAFSFGLGHAVLLIPFLLGRRFLASEAALRGLLAALAAAGLVYSLPALLEVRLSPQLNVWIYGFFPSDFIQQMRAGGFRPVVFLGHGLLAAQFFAMALLAGGALWRISPKPARRPRMLALVWLTITLVLCKTLSALLYAAALLPMILFSGRMLQRPALLAMGLVVLLYPALRGADLVPTDRMVALAASYNEERAASLHTRFFNENRLLARAAEQPLFGWGGWGRSRVYDPVTGQDISTTDGRWVIVIGLYGWVGYVAEFGLLVWPLLHLSRRRVGNAAPLPILALGLILGMNLVDLLPNSGLTPITWLISGGLCGLLERVSADTPRSAGPAPVPAARAEADGALVERRRGVGAG